MAEQYGTIPFIGFISQDTDDKSFHFDTYQTGLSYRIPVCEISFQHRFSIPDSFHPINSHIQKLEGDLAKAVEAYYGLKAEIEGKIADLKCISYDQEIAPKSEPFEFSDDIPS
jgi:hypothetical protein